MDPTLTEPFPSLEIARDQLLPKGAFALAQAEFLEPDATLVSELQNLLQQKNAGVVAHFYMDPELQGVLSACDWPHIHVSDSLAMADRAIEMAEAGVSCIIVLGVDFMSENVRAMLDASGHAGVKVFRVARSEIGCSLAESAEKDAYRAYLERAAATPRSLHVVYINTSLTTKAQAQAIVPTITCTSSNVVKTVLQAAAQVPGIHIWFGPDTYMGENLAHLFESLLSLSDAEIAALHPAHDRKSVSSLLERFHYFKEGTCIVHHMFGKEVVQQVERAYSDAMITAHLEVPGEMFALGLEAQKEQRGVVGSTSNILNFILSQLDQALQNANSTPLRFILGTEAGMITPIVRGVQQRLRASGSAHAQDTRVEIIFPVASEAIAQAPDHELKVLPGVAAGEGCSTAGGCATCPYMKMNSLKALLTLLREINVAADETLVPFYPKKYEQSIQNRSVADIGSEPILHMRAFQRDAELPAELVADILARNQGASVG